MKQAGSIIIGPWAPALQTPTPIQCLWDRYQAAAAEKARVYALFNETEAAGDDAEVDRVEAVCDQAYNVLEDIADAILRSRPTTAADLKIKAQVVARGKCTEAEIAAFCRDVQIAASSLEARR